MKRLTIGLVVGLLAFAAGVAAQDRIFPFRGAFQDTYVSQPCAPNGGLKGAVAPMIYDRNAWLVYTCADDTVVLRRYLNPNDNVSTPTPVFVVPAPFDPAAVCRAYPGFVPTKDGTGCVPPDHPAAR